MSYTKQSQYSGFFIILLRTNGALVHHPIMNDHVFPTLYGRGIKPNVMTLIVNLNHCEKFRTLISNSWPILQTSVTFPAHVSIGMYGIKLIFECHITENAGSKGLQDSNDG